MADSYSEKAMLSSALGRTDLSVTILDHPLARSYLSVMRDSETNTTTFRQVVDALAEPLIFLASQDLTEKSQPIKTPLAPIQASAIRDEIVFLPVLRSGLGMLRAAQKTFELVKSSTTIVAGMARDEATAIPHWYYDLKEIEGLNKGSGSVFFILDPMLATGGSAQETIKRIFEIYPEARVKLVSMIAAPEGIRVVNEAYPEVQIYVAAVDSHLNEKKYIVPGLGDAGDRQFATL